MELLALFAFAFMVFVYLMYRLHPSFSKHSHKRLTLAEKEALKAKRREEFHKIVEQHCALRNTMNKGLKVSDYTMEQMIEMYNENTKEETIRLAITQLGMTREEAIEKGFIHGSTQVAIELRCRKESERLGREITA